MTDQPHAADFSIDDVLAEAQLPRHEVPICLRGDLIATWQDLERRFKHANQASDDDDTIASATAPEAIDLARQMEAVQAQMRAATRVFLVSAIPSSEWQQLLKAHPPANDEEAQVADFNRATFPVAAAAKCCVRPAMSVAQAGRLVDTIADGEWTKLFSHIWMLNTGGVDVPFSSAASAVLGGSASKPR